MEWRRRARTLGAEPDSTTEASIGAGAITVIMALADAGWAAMLGAVGTMAVVGAGWSVGRPLHPRARSTLFAVLFFVALTQFPLPDRAGLASLCPMYLATPEWTPFAFAFELLRRAEVVGVVPALVGGRLALATAMNLLVPGLIGAALARHRIRARTAVAFGLVLSLGVELTQLTAVWGLYPCAYRQFDINDLLLNTLGTALGFWVARRVMGGRAARRPDRRSVSSRAP